MKIIFFSIIMILTMPYALLAGGIDCENALRPKVHHAYMRLMHLDSSRRTQFALYALHSDKWRSYLYAVNHHQEPEIGIHTLVTELIRESGIFDEYNIPLAKCGMRITVSWAEKIATKKFSSLGITKDGKPIQDNTQVPVDALIQINLVAK